MKLEDADAHNIRSIYIKGKEEEQYFTLLFFCSLQFSCGAVEFAQKGDRRHSRRRFEFDDESKRVTHVGIGGDVFNYYKSYRPPGK